MKEKRDKRFININQYQSINQSINVFFIILQHKIDIIVYIMLYFSTEKEDMFIFPNIDQIQFNFQ